MMTTSQERQIRRLLKSGGGLTITGKQLPIQLDCKRATAKPANPSAARWDIDELIVKKGERIVNSYYRWKAHALYPLLASQMDALLDAQEVSA